MKILLVSLGCDKNLVDSEMMLGQLHERGYTFTDDEEEAQAVIINTCCFIGDAKEESIDTILEFGRRRQSGQLKALIVAGCLAQRYERELQQEMPEVDAIIGTISIDTIADTLDSVLAGRPQNHVTDCDSPIVYGKKRILTTGGYYAYLKIAEGCDKHCTYCIIPKIRGSYRSVPMEVLVKEAKELADNGVKELILVAQETTIYGTDLYGEKCLPRLLRKLCAVPGLAWIRVLYCYPEEITPELIEVMKEEPKICHYLDIPIQHASDEVLKRMGRKTSRKQLEEMIGALRREIPDICLRTTLITGFPGETEADFETLAEFVDTWEFDRLGVFPYSQEEDTPAAAMPDQVPEDVKEYRRDEIMQLQQEIAFEKAEAMVGQTVTAMIEGRLAEGEAYVARTYKDAPGVDGYLFVHTDRNLMSGDFVTVRITGSYEYDLIGEMEDESAE